MSGEGSSIDEYALSHNEIVTPNPISKRRGMIGYK